ncbi:unnamed protein product [Rhodiola kirilowii]
MAFLLSWTSPACKKLFSDTHFNHNALPPAATDARCISFKPRIFKQYASSGSSSASETKLNEESISIDVLKNFIKINVGKWTGSFYQFDANGKLLNTIPTKLSASSYGEDELISLIQTLYIRQPLSNTSISGSDEQPEWWEYKIKETNMFTVDKYQQIGFFQDERAFALRYQTAGMLDTILRQGVLGEDDTGEESPKNTIESEKFLGKWKGHSVTKRSGVYGATIAESDTISSLEYDDNGQLIQEMSSTSDGGDVTTNVHWTGTLSNNLITFDKGYQLTLLPGGMYMGCPCNIANSVADSKSFHLEFCWLGSATKRQRLVRTFDIEGLAVSSTYFSETKL